MINFILFMVLSTFTTPKQDLGACAKYERNGKLPPAAMHGDSLCWRQGGTQG